MDRTLPSVPLSRQVNFGYDRLLESSELDARPHCAYIAAHEMPHHVYTLLRAVLLHGEQSVSGCGPNFPIIKLSE
ncbi:MAG: hypothetical protein ABSA96_16990 [Candidatus Acidiferrales bacterium]